MRGLRRLSRGWALYFFGGGALSVLFAACTGDDPSLTSSKDDAGIAGDTRESGADTSVDAPVTDAPADAPAIEASVTRPECARVAPMGCAPTALGAGGGGAPKLHIDACALPDLAVERELTTWKPVVGPDLPPAPKGGGIYCSAGINGRPAVRFEGSRGYERANASELDYTDTFIMVAALVYEQRAGVPGSIIFQRSAGDDAANGFPGPVLVGNVTYVTTFGSTSIDPSPGLGFQLRLGTKPISDTPTSTESIAAATADYRAGAQILVARLVPSTPPSQKIELRLNGKFEKNVILSNGFTSTGAGEVLRLGHTSQDANSFVGYLGELMVFTNERSDLMDIETAMLTKWGVPRAM